MMMKNEQAKPMSIILLKRGLNVISVRVSEILARAQLMIGGPESNSYFAVTADMLERDHVH